VTGNPEKENIIETFIKNSVADTIPHYVIHERLSLS
jgi:hypothetical protein